MNVKGNGFASITELATLNGCGSDVDVDVNDDNKMNSNTHAHTLAGI